MGINASPATQFATGSSVVEKKDLVRIPPSCHTDICMLARTGPAIKCMAVVTPLKDESLVCLA